ncbi:hypothetical protein FSP39_007558 [Pinctada imbricata]|uniref:GPR158/179 extracellular domain-containing protein n=1 Tax=Pinctada imbricata TaxID=66713 RepID=A0AA88XIB1_PINIB|nr:hypothetical protein FSP39_007558 [Pinctada imbricata]
MERLLVTAVVLLSAFIVCDKSVYDWIPGDAYGRIDGMMTSIQKSSDCKAKPKASMTLPADAVSQIPKFNELKTKIFYKNRTSLVHLHNMALNRAFFYSYIFQKLNKSQSDFEYQPTWFYMYISATADTNANKDVFNGSSYMFDNHQYYPNWLVNLDFNRTVPLFGVKSYRFDDTFDMGVILREPTGRTNVVTDLGAVSNYTHEAYKMNPWYPYWLPDNSDSEDSVLKFTYSVGIRYSNETGKFISDEYESTAFFGPNSPGQSEDDERYLPVRFTPAYYDCKFANKWVVSAVSPIVDFMVRYSNFTHLRRPRFVGVAVMDIDFLRIDFNACPVSIGNPGPSYLSGVSKCKTATTQCKHKMGFGFSRGGYTCICNSGFSYAFYKGPPFQGGNYEQATEYEYKKGYYCKRTGFLRVLPVVEQPDGVQIVNPNAGDQAFETGRYSGRQLRSVNITKREAEQYGPLDKVEVVRETIQKREVLRQDFIDQQYAIRQDNIRKRKKRNKKRKRRRAEFSHMAVDRMHKILDDIGRVTKDNCHNLSPTAHYLPGDVAYGVETQFDTQARFALRLSHLLSNWMQNVQAGENFGYLKGGGRIHYEVLYGEVLSNVMSDHKVISSGVFFEPNVFEEFDGKTREYFGALAYRDNDENIMAIDMAGLPERYTENEWYVRLRQRWKTNTSGLQKYRMKSLVRSDINGTSAVKFEYYPMGYKAPHVGQGIWTRPYFRCDGRVNRWVITYAVPFIGMDNLRTSLKFKGVATVDIPLKELDIDQCAASYNIQNAFKNTARCDYQSQQCSQIPGYNFDIGSYKCGCRQGYEYPFKDGRNFFHGSLMEIEYQKKIQGKFNLFDDLKCRVIGGSAVISINLNLLITAILSACVLLKWNV